MSSRKEAITKADILHLATLANLPLNEQEIKKYTDQLAETITYVENLSELDTTDAPETFHNTNLTNQYFADGTVNNRGLTSEEATSNAKVKQNGFFVVPRIMNND